MVATLVAGGRIRSRAKAMRFTWEPARCGKSTMKVARETSVVAGGAARFLRSQPNGRGVPRTLVREGIPTGPKGWQLPTGWLQAPTFTVCSTTSQSSLRWRESSVSLRAGSTTPGPSGQSATRLKKRRMTGWREPCVVIWTWTSSGLWSPNRRRVRRRLRRRTRSAPGRRVRTPSGDGQNERTYRGSARCRDDGGCCSRPRYWGSRTPHSPGAAHGTSDHSVREDRTAPVTRSGRPAGGRSRSSPGSSRRHFLDNGASDGRAPTRARIPHSSLVARHDVGGTRIGPGSAAGGGGSGGISPAGPRGGRDDRRPGNGRDDPRGGCGGDYRERG